MAMSRKHYVEVAKIIRDCTTYHDQDGGHAIVRVDELTRRLATVFADDNPRFSRMRFFEAAGLEEGK